MKRPVIPPEERPKIGKLRACLTQLETAIFLMLRGIDPISVHTLLSASKGILRGLHAISPNHVLGRLDQSVGDLVKPGMEKEWHLYEHRAANFLKHADRDPHDRLEGFDVEGVNVLEAVLCILAVWEYVTVLPETIFIGLIFVTEHTSSFFDYHKILLERPEGRRVLASLGEMPGQYPLLDVFELALKMKKSAAFCPIQDLPQH